MYFLCSDFSSLDLTVWSIRCLETSPGLSMSLGRRLFWGGLSPAQGQAARVWQSGQVVGERRASKWSLSVTRWSQCVALNCSLETGLPRKRTASLFSAKSSKRTYLQWSDKVGIEFYKGERWVQNKTPDTIDVILFIYWNKNGTKANNAFPLLASIVWVAPVWYHFCPKPIEYTWKSHRFILGDDYKFSVGW